ncbi:MAG: class I SAM-dependent methyltransferase [Rhodospirillaceae bacterium]|nr:class I SAM-dependent methyltransferase [Rhodospirillales bacterium]
MPFRGGAHERVFYGLSRGACSLSDGSSLLEAGAQPDEGGVIFRAPPERLDQQVAELIGTPGALDRRRDTLLMLRKLGESCHIHTVLDGGCGEGTYRTLLGPHLPGAKWIGIEVWQPYVDAFKLAERYDRLVVEDLRRAAFDKFGPVDLAIFGDVLEHMTKSEAMDVVARASAVAPYVLISIPVVEYAQDETFGNPYEVHVKDDWDHYEVMRTFPGITAFFIHDHIGVYLLTTTAEASTNVTQLQHVIPALVRQQCPNDRMAWGAWQMENHL